MNASFKIKQVICFLCGVLCNVLLISCATLPKIKHTNFDFPEQGVYVETPLGDYAKRPYEPLGWVRSKATYSTLESETSHSQTLCKNYYHKAAKQLLKEAQKAGADAVIKVRSVVLLLDGKIEEYPTPECADDGAEGEILLKGIAIRYKPIQDLQHEKTTQKKP